MNAPLKQKTAAIIVCGGSGLRMGLSVNKVLLPIRRLSCAQRSALLLMPFSREMIVVCRREDESELKMQLSAVIPMNSVKLVIGGNTRRKSVENGLSAVLPDTEYVIIHDGARPLATPAIVERSLEAAKEYGSGICAVKCVDTIKRADENCDVTETLDRSGVFVIQTPQSFSYPLIMKAYAADMSDTTDDAALIEKTGVKARLVEGDRRNIKLTTREDIGLMEAFLPVKTRVGHGFDVHKLVPGRKLILCGVDIPCEKGLLGHSDADVALHALMDALLGAAGEHDIGRHFPDSDERYKGISSLLLLDETVKILRAHGASVENADITIVAQKPKLMKYIDEMRGNIAAHLGIDTGAVNVKATTTEGLGFEGEGLGISASAVALISFPQAQI
ncbi:MAG: 2-C-methyl-D-erythritol 2,4-cyclodiphosphate synthase [Eubacteriales bacterium]|nr:2-C-methyl-D-erythritol 2,4-cyclodiphosphate synthase [Eubacteriales bacterium]MDD3882707.1 2-C-methyl-D-erythritol 2,4-cyclodiphosphate synthase [Eubacteriales bacterium]MDD4512672.1 2-C-methyl-D-erythritol 2,4-cyclodiphosphate synthase [Eubacteriales bacterium]